MSTETLLVLRAVLPSFCITFIGYLLGRYDRNLHQKTVSNLIYYIFSPSLIFSSLHRRTFNPAEFITIGAAVIVLIAVMIPVAFFFKNRAGIKDRGYYLPIVFMSTGTISLPISMLLYGNEGLAKAVLFHMINILVLYSLGVFMVNGKSEMREFFKIPALYATVLGILCAVFPLDIPVGIQEFFWLAEKGIDILAYGAIPLMILSFGYSLNEARLDDMKDGMIGGMLRIIGGPILAFAVVFIFRAAGWLPMEKGYDLLSYLDLRTTEAVIILNAAMPGPIMAYLLNVKFDGCAGKAATMLTVGTLGGIVTIPLVLHLVNVYIFG